MTERRVLGVLLVGLCGVTLSGLCLGSHLTTPWQILENLFGEVDSAQRMIFVSFRIPRLILAAEVGSALAVSGVLVQCVLRNNLAEPGIMGTSSGGNLGSTLAIVLSGFQLVSPWTVPVMSILCSMTTVLLVCALAYDHQALSPKRLLLTGVAVNTAVGAATLVVSLNIDRQAYAQALAWTAGSFNKADWNYVVALSALLTIALPGTWIFSRTMDLLSLRDDQGMSLGVSVRFWRIFLLLYGVSIGAAGMSAVGSVAFVGLVAPHIGRRLVGTRHRRLLPAAALVGSSLVVFADTLGRTLFLPIEIPAGVVASALGGLFFLYLLLTTRG